MSPKHSAVVRNLARLLAERLPDGFSVQPRDTETSPDLAVIREGSGAVLVIEVAREKTRIHAEAGVPEYWLVRPDHRWIVVHREPAATGYRSVQIHTGAGAIALQAVSAKLSPAEVFVGLL